MLSDIIYDNFCHDIDALIGNIGKSIILLLWILYRSSGIVDGGMVSMHVTFVQRHLFICWHIFLDKTLLVTLNIFFDDETVASEIVVEGTSFINASVIQLV